jgi:hypothetical protein
VNVRLAGALRSPTRSSRASSRSSTCPCTTSDRSTFFRRTLGRIRGGRDAVRGRSRRDLGRGHVVSCAEPGASPSVSPSTWQSGVSAPGNRSWSPSSRTTVSPARLPTSADSRTTTSAPSPRSGSRSSSHARGRGSSSRAPGST